MKLLIDTHVFLWLRSAPDRITDKVLKVYQDPNNSVYLSIFSIWEMQIKAQLGKLELEIPLKRLIEEQCESNRIRILPLKIGSCLQPAGIAAPA